MPAGPVRATTVILTLAGGVDIMGALIEQGDGLFVLRGARVGVQTPQGIDWTELEGETVVPRERVQYWQRGLDPKIIAAALKINLEEGA